MRRSLCLATAALVVSAASPAGASPALVIGLIAVGAIGIAAGTHEEPSPAAPAVSPGGGRAAARRPAQPAPRPAADEEEDEAWEYTDKHGWVGGAPEVVSTINSPLKAKPGASQKLVSACRDAVAKKAEPYGVASLEAVGAGKQSRVKGRIVVPVEMRAIYRVRGVHEVKRSTVRCEVDRAGRVIATS
jgi:hypothetical protein